MITIKKLMPLAMIVLAFGCKKSYIDDINKNPNTVSGDAVTAELILPNALSNGAARITAYGWLNNWMGYWSPSGSFAPNTEESTYNITNTFNEGGNWSANYNVLFDLALVERKAAAEGLDFYIACAKVVKSQLFQNLVDMYGNVPYSQSFNATIKSPAYDKGEDIYLDLQKQLDEAINILKTKPVAPKAAQYDLVFQGNANRWIKYANTLKLRLLIRQTQVTGFNPASEIAKITANGGGFLMAGENAAAVPPGGYLNQVGKQNPYYAVYGLLPNGSEANDFFRANNHVLNMLKSNSDTRLTRLFRPAVNPTNPADPYIGTTYGLPPSTALEGPRTSNIGLGINKSFAMPMWYITSFESLFFQAEAIQRGWLPGNAQAAYEAAVTESFAWLGLGAVNATSYLAGSFANWAGASNKLNLIITQKYIANTGINPIEAYSDWRRLGIPATSGFVSQNPSRVSNTLPVRLNYPSSETLVNSANVAAQGTVNVFTSNVFWDK
jgi:hypothetical protein